MGLNYWEGIPDKKGLYDCKDSRMMGKQKQGDYFGSNVVFNAPVIPDFDVRLKV